MKKILTESNVFLHPGKIKSTSVHVSSKNHDNVTEFAEKLPSICFFSWNFFWGAVSSSLTYMLFKVKQIHTKDENTAFYPVSTMIDSEIVGQSQERNARNICWGLQESKAFSLLLKLNLCKQAKVCRRQVISSSEWRLVYHRFFCYLPDQEI